MVHKAIFFESIYTYTIIITIQSIKIHGYNVGTCGACTQISLFNLKHEIVLQLVKMNKYTTNEGIVCNYQGECDHVLTVKS